MWHIQQFFEFTIHTSAVIAVFNLLPKKFRLIYEKKKYKTFCVWKTITTVTAVKEKILLKYI